MNERFSKPTTEKVNYRKPYYLTCEICGSRIVGDTPDEVINVAVYNGWRWDNLRNRVYCATCLDLVVWFGVSGWNRLENKEER